MTIGCIDQYFISKHPEGQRILIEQQINYSLSWFSHLPRNYIGIESCWWQSRCNSFDFTVEKEIEFTNLFILLWLNDDHLDSFRVLFPISLFIDWLIDYMMIGALRCFSRLDLSSTYVDLHTYVISIDNVTYLSGLFVLATGLEWHKREHRKFWLLFEKSFPSTEWKLFQLNSLDAEYDAFHHWILIEKKLSYKNRPLKNSTTSKHSNNSNHPFRIPTGENAF